MPKRTTRNDTQKPASQYLTQSKITEQNRINYDWDIYSLSSYIHYDCSKQNCKISIEHLYIWLNESERKIIYSHIPVAWWGYGMS